MNPYGMEGGPRTPLVHPVGCLSMGRVWRPIGVLVPKEERSRSDEESQPGSHTTQCPGGEAIGSQHCEGSCLRPEDACSFSSLQGSQGEAMTWDCLAGTVSEAEK